MMRFLQVASRYQVQLGWLRVIADAIGDGRKSVEEVAEVLLGSRDQFNLWWEEAGHGPPARGIAQPATANRAARIGATYGIHDADNQGTLTPLGHVLRHVGPWRGLESPFSWRGPTQWLGLWMVFSVSGDVLLASFRGWPDGGLYAESAADFMADVLRRLARSTHGESRKMLRNQASRASGELRFARNFLIYPYLEPVRDLGYLEAHGRAGGYRLTPSGARLVEVLDDGRSADAWLEEGLHRAFLIADGEPDPQPATAAIFPSVLESIPVSIARVPGRAPLAIVTLLAQCRLLEARRWLDLRLSRVLLEEVSARSGGAVRLEGDMLCWEPAALDAALWSSASRTAVHAGARATVAGLEPRTARPLSLLPSPQPSRATPARTQAATPASRSSRSPSSRTPSSRTPSSRTPSSRTPSSRTPSSRLSAPRPSLSLSSSPSAGVPQLAPQRAQKTSSDALVEEWSLGEGLPVRQRLWLQHVAERLRSPTPGRLLRWSGPRAALARLRSILASGGPVEAIDAEPLRAALDVLAPLEGEALLRRAADRWGGAVADVALRATLERAERSTDRLRVDLQERVRAGLRGEGSWSRLAAATDALVSDALVLEGRSPAHLLDALRRFLQESTPITATDRFLGELLATSRPYTYLQQVSGAFPPGPSSGGVTVVEAPGLSPQRQIWVQLSARDASEAMRMGRARASHVASVLAYAARCPVPVVVTEALSPAASPPSPDVRGLLLSSPLPPPLPLESLIWASPVSGDSDPERLSAVLQSLARAERAPAIWPSLSRLAADPLIVLPAAGALAFAGAWLAESLQQAEAALLDATLTVPTPGRLAVLEQWAGTEAVEDLQRASATAPVLRSLQIPAPPLRPLGDVVRLLQERGPELSAQLGAHIRDRWPLAAERLEQATLALTAPSTLAGLAGIHRAALRELLAALRTDAPVVSWQQDEPPVRLLALRGALDPVLLDAAAALRSGVPLDLHWGAILDRFDDLRSLSSAVSAERLLEILSG